MQLIDILEGRLWQLDRVPWCRPGLELHLVESQLTAYDTGERMPTPAALAEAIPRMSRRSLFYPRPRGLAAGERPTISRPGWRPAGRTRRLVARLRAIDFYFLNLNQLREELVEVFRQSPARYSDSPGGDAMQLLDRYEEVVGHREVQWLRQLAAPLAGKRIVHVNSTATGGGVAEILGWMVPLMNELGLEARWEVIQGPPEFYRVTKAFHNGLQGLPVSLKPKDFDLHYEVNRENAQRLNLQADVVFVHDPQPVVPSAVYAAGAGAVLDMALPHRRLAPGPVRLEAHGGGHPRLPGHDLLHGRVHPPAAAPDVPHSPVDRSAVRQELPDARGGAPGDLEPAGHRPASGRCSSRSRGSTASRTRWA